MNINYFKYKYINFIKNGLFRENTRSLNTSIAKISDNIYLYAVRIIHSELQKDTDLFIPGNSEKCEKLISVGKNYWWNNWQNSNVSISEGTYFFVGNHNTNDLELYKVMCNKITIIPRFPSMAKDFLCNAYNYRSDFLSYVDVRISNMNDKIYMWLYNLTMIGTVTVDHDTKTVIIEQVPIDNIQPDFQFGKNQQIVTLKESPIIMQVTYIDWYYDDGIYLFTINYDINRGRGFYPGLSYIDNTIYYNKFKIRGSGCYHNNKQEDKIKFGINYGIMPSFSFSTPLVYLDNNRYIGVGHLKIHSDIFKYPYINGSKIDIFRRQLYEDYEAKFGNKYIKHYGTGIAPHCEGYIYMMYFYIVNINNTVNNNSMYISDGYLPIYLSNYEDNYKFSLIFPMGLTKNEDKLIVTCGEGDYYSNVLEFSVNDVINLCKYDASNLDLTNYNYNIIGYFSNNNYYVAPSLKDILIKNENSDNQTYKSLYGAMSRENYENNITVDRYNFETGNVVDIHHKKKYKLIK